MNAPDAGRKIGSRKTEKQRRWQRDLVQGPGFLANQGRKKRPDHSRGLAKQLRAKKIEATLAGT